MIINLSSDLPTSMIAHKEVAEIRNLPSVSKANLFEKFNIIIELMRSVILSKS